MVEIDQRFAGLDFLDHAGHAQAVGTCELDDLSGFGNQAVGKSVFRDAARSVSF